MYIRQKPNRSGKISIQIIDKSSGEYKVLKTIGSSDDPVRIKNLIQQAQEYINKLTGQIPLPLEYQKEKDLVDQIFESVNAINLVGPDLILGKLFDEIGFNKIDDALFRDLVISRLCYPASKLKTADYLYRHKGIRINVNRIYRYLDKLHRLQKENIEQISYKHTLKLLEGGVGIVFYDVTTIYFEIEEPDDLRKTGFSKEGRHQHPQILLGLLVSMGGYPLAYEIFEGNKFEGHTMLPVIESFQSRFNLENPIIVADSGLLSKTNITELEKKQYEYIIGCRLKNEKEIIQQQILSLSLENGQSVEIELKDTSRRLIVGYSKSRARKDFANRQRGLDKLERAISTGKLTKKNINNRGYNKYLRLEGTLKVSIDYGKWEDDAKWDGLKGYITNTQLNKDNVLEQYGNLWKIEKAFRISKTDLRIRPIYHRLRHRIEAHICISFCAYKIYKELERRLKTSWSTLSPEKAIEIANTVYKITINTPITGNQESRIHIQNEEQLRLMKMFNS
jgi:transposase